MSFSKILSTSSYVPCTVRTNADLEKILGTDLENGGTTDEWILSRVGIKERRIAAKHETHEYMATEAIKNALQKAGIHAKDASLILAGNTHLPGLFPCKASASALQPDSVAFDVIASNIQPVYEASEMLFGIYVLSNNRATKLQRGHGSGTAFIDRRYHKKSLAEKIAKDLGMDSKRSFDVTTGCASFNYGLALADALVRNNRQYIVVAAVDKMLDVTNPKDRSTVVLFGELAGAAVLGPSQEPGFISHSLHTDGSLRDKIGMRQEDGWDKPYFWQDGKAVYKWALPKIVDLTQTAISAANGSKIFIVPHQANPRMLEQACKNKIFSRISGTVITGDLYGNSSTASIAHALHTVLTNGVPGKNGDLIVPAEGDILGIMGFGAGLSDGLNVYQVPKS